MAEINKVVFTGQEGSGKSLELAKLARSLIYRNARWFKKTGIPRPIVSNMRFSPSFHLLAEKKGVPIHYYSTLQELTTFSECDVFIDELVKYFSSHQWKDMSPDTISWITQGGKQGIKMYGSSQNFGLVEKTFRNLTSRVFVINKLVGSRRPMKTSPKVRFVWGFYSSRRVKPSSFKGDEVTMEQYGFPQIYRIKKKDCKIFDTSQKIEKSPPLPLEHIQRVCNDCGKVHISHK